MILHRGDPSQTSFLHDWQLGQKVHDVFTYRLFSGTNVRILSPLFWVCVGILRAVERFDSYSILLRLE